MPLRIAKTLLGRIMSYLGGGRYAEAPPDSESSVGSRGKELTKEEKTNGKNQRLKRVRQRITKVIKKNPDVETLRAELARTRRALSLADPDDRVFPIFFVVGFAKSGTYWLTRILDSHPEILCRGEGIFFGRGADLGKQRGLIIPTSLYGALADSEYLQAWVKRSIWTRGDDVDRHLAQLTRMAIKYFLGKKLTASGKRIVGDKTPFVTEECLSEIKLIIPEAKVMHIIRDGRDIAVSATHHLWNHTIDAGGHMNLKSEELVKRDAYRRDPEGFVASGESLFDEERLRKGFAESWSNMTTRAVDDGPAVLGDNYTEVRYEDLLAQPDREVERLLDFLGANANEETVKRCVEATSFERMARRKRGEEESSSFFRKGVAGDWENIFTEEDKQVFKEVAGDLLIKLGYEKDYDW